MYFLRKYHILLWHIPAPLLFRVREATDALLKFRKLAMLFWAVEDTSVFLQCL